MISRQIAGGIVIGIGVLMTAIAGLWLATEARASDLNGADIFLRAFLAFVVTVPLILVGIYVLVRNEPDKISSESISDIEQQRQLIDLIRTRQHATFTELAQETGLSEVEVVEQLQSLIQLSIFSGYVQWTSGYVVVMQQQNLLNLEQCAYCNQPISVEPKTVTTCLRCGTEYYTI